MVSQSPAPEFLGAKRLAELTGLSVRTIHNQRCTGTGLGRILTKLGGKLGAWRADFELFAEQSRRTRAPQAASKRQGAQR